MKQKCFGTIGSQFTEYSIVLASKLQRVHQRLMKKRRREGDIKKTERS
jgi:hypothetical protein